MLGTAGVQGLLGVIVKPCWKGLANWRWYLMDSWFRSCRFRSICREEDVRAQGGWVDPFGIRPFSYSAISARSNFVLLQAVRFGSLEFSDVGRRCTHTCAYLFRCVLIHAKVRPCERLSEIVV